MKTALEENHETLVRLAPDDENAAGMYSLYLQHVQGFTEEEASVKVQLLQLLTKRDLRHTRALDLLSGKNPQLGELIQQVLAELPSVVEKNVKFDVVRGMIAPYVTSVTDNPEKRLGVPMVRVGADFVLRIAGEFTEKPATAKKPPKKPSKH